VSYFHNLMLQVQIQKL